MATSLTLQNDPTLPQGYLKVNGTTAATITENGISTPTLNTISVDDYTILSDFTGTNQSLTTSGFQKLPGGLIIQWGLYPTDITTETTITITLPISYTTTHLTVLATPRNIIPTIEANVYAQVRQITNTSFGFFNNYPGTGTNLSNGFYWISLGY